MLGLSCNVSMMYTELPFAKRFEAAASDGFRCVELWTAPGTDDARVAIDAVRQWGLAVSVVNVNPGPAPNDFGQLGNPDRIGWWRTEFLRTAEFATVLGCRHINVLAGGQLPTGRDRQLGTIIANLSWALATVDGRELTLLLEPLNGTDWPCPLIRRTEDVQTIREALSEPSALRLLFDAYHVYQEHDDLSEAFRAVVPIVGHVQLADFPGRHEPGTGQVDMTEFVDCIANSGYDGWLGLEYHPSETPAKSLDWARGIPALQPHFTDPDPRPAQRSVVS
jgi:hydroxypyruvate isomerase